jgi:hypothetical protein
VAGGFRPRGGPVSPASDDTRTAYDPAANTWTKTAGDVIRDAAAGRRDTRGSCRCAGAPRSPRGRWRRSSRVTPVRSGLEGGPGWA